MLEVKGLHAYYGKSHVLQGVDLQVDEKEIVGLLGRNGVGRSTTLKAIMGGVTARGSVRFKGEEILGLAPYDIARRGIGLVPENRDVFPTLSVYENLLIGIKSMRRPGRWSIDDIVELFPNLRQRLRTKAGFLSGGEQQMLSIGRTLMGDPALIMVDEPTEGLAPQVVHQVGELLKQIASLGVAILLVEQKLSIIMRVSHRLAVMGHGQIVFNGTPDELRADQDVRRKWLEV
ncbi:MAG TPA: ABC transporter ATP-binding protein [Gammaproteobacteria bacterium]|nr:ABC transporter ATP-binding protein [Gammaproteobacteria bacterium]